MNCIKLNSIIDHSLRDTPEQQFCNVKDGEKKNPGSVPLIQIPYSGVHSGPRPILHPSLVEILPVVSVLFCSPNQPTPGHWWKHNLHGRGNGAINGKSQYCRWANIQFSFCSIPWNLVFIVKQTKIWKAEMFTDNVLMVHYVWTGHLTLNSYLKRRGSSISPE